MNNPVMELTAGRYSLHTLSDCSISVSNKSDGICFYLFCCGCGTASSSDQSTEKGKKYILILNTELIIQPAAMLP